MSEAICFNKKLLSSAVLIVAVLILCSNVVDSGLYNCYVCTSLSHGDKCGKGCCQGLPRETSCLACGAENALLPDGSLTVYRRHCIPQDHVLLPKGCKTSDSGDRVGCTCYGDMCNDLSAFDEDDKEKNKERQKDVDAPQKPLDALRRLKGQAASGHGSAALVAVVTVVTSLSVLWT